MNHQILRSTPATLELIVYSEGTPADLDATPTLVVTDGNGTVVASGAVTKPGSTTGIYRSVLPAQADLKVLDAAWTGALGGEALVLHQDYEIVGNFLFTESEARSVKIVGGQNALEDDTKYPDSLISDWRAVIGELFEQRLNQGVIQRYCRVRFTGWTNPLDLTFGYPMLSTGVRLNRPGRAWDVSRVISATVNGVAQTVSELEIVGSKIYHTSGSWSGASISTPLNVTVEYEYGPDPVGAEAHQRALDLLLANASPKGYPTSATSISNEDGTFRISTFPVLVDEFLKANKHRLAFGVA